MAAAASSLLLKLGRQPFEFQRRFGASNLDLSGHRAPASLAVAILSWPLCASLVAFGLDVLEGSESGSEVKPCFLHLQRGAAAQRCV